MTESNLLFGARAIIVMGVTGCGKSTIGEGVSERLGWPFIEGDALHPTTNVRKMASGEPLTDADRWPWLDTVGGAMREALDGGASGVVASCSALRRAYRERLTAASGENLRFVFLDGSIETIGERLAAREHHFMPASLLRSQFETLERPAPDEPVLSVSIEARPAEVISEVARQVSSKPD